MQNRLHKSPLWLVLAFASIPLWVQGQAFDFNYPGPLVFILDENCEAVFDFGGMPPTVTSQIGAEIIPPTGVDTLLTGYTVGEIIDEDTGIDVYFVAYDDQGNIDTFIFYLAFSDQSPPEFITPTPADLFLECPGEFPAAVSRQFTDNCSAFTGTILSMDSDSVPNFVCGDSLVITRRWTVTDSEGNISEEIQLITILPDTTPPVILNFPEDTAVSCDVYDYLTWRNDQRAAILSTAFDNCGDIFLEDDGPNSFDTPCDTITVQFILKDLCNNADTVSATYIAVDTLAPVLVGVPNDTTVACADGVPLAASVTATDNCDPLLGLPMLTEFSTQTSDSSCTDFSYTLTRVWTIADQCGNMTIDSQVITVVDDLAPTFEAPADTTLDCSSAGLPDEAGEPANVADNCAPSLLVTFADSIADLLCPQNVQIFRTWYVEDPCGNIDSALQVITLVDTLAPSFVPPTDTVFLQCDQTGDLGITGQPADIIDSCDNAPEAFFIESQTDLTCPGSYTLLRTWYVQDACGNTDSSLQVLIVTDTVSPVLVAPADDVVIPCGTDTDAESVFAAWIASFGNALATDNCTPEPGLIWAAFNTGTSDPAFLPAPDCSGSQPGVYRTQTVDFVVADSCGNSLITTATFTVEDNVAPEITFCPADTAVANDAGLCTATVTLPPPSVSETCGLDPITINPSITLPVTSPAPPGEELNIVVDPMVFNFSVPAFPVVALGNVALEVNLIEVDGEKPGEVFVITGDDGGFLDSTNLTNVQCGNSTTLIVIDAETFNTWAADGVVTITLTPNPPPPGLPGRFSVNDICQDGEVETNLSYQAGAPDGLRFEYSINGGARTPVVPLGPVTATFDQGVNEVTYFVIDCAGNETACSFDVIVEDEEAPVITCPVGFSALASPDLCETEVQLPLPLDAQDNCGAGMPIVVESQTDSLLTFFFDPDLDEYLANDKVFTFSGVTANAIGSVTLTLEMRADVDSLGEYFIVRDPFGMPLGTTEVGQPNVTPGSCLAPGFKTFTIPSSVFNGWAMSGSFNITADVFDNFVLPPGGAPGIGINACEPANIAGNGDSDEVSYVKAYLTYETLNPFYSVSGATTLPLTPVTDVMNPPTITLNQGTNTVTYQITDLEGNTGACTFDITIDDNQNPVALCQNTIVDINPNGVVVDTIFPMEIDNGSFDNCSIAFMSVMPNLITCDRIGDTLTVTLTVIDDSGNLATCNSLIRVEGEEPALDYSVGACGGDTLFLFATPPSAPGGNLWFYEWTGPNGFSSTEQNPFIPNASGANAGSYELTVEGITGCMSTGEIQVTVQDLPLTPVLSFSDNNICQSENIILLTTPVSGSGSIQYLWYEGSAPNGVLVGTTPVASLTLSGPHTPGTRCFYVVVERNGCPSFPSASLCVTITGTPTALTDNDVIDVCEGGSFTLGTPVSGLGITYSWQGPGFSSTLQYPLPIADVSSFNDGIYTLTVFDNGCPSAPAFTVVNVLDQPTTPSVFNPTTSANPACASDTIVLATNIVSGVTSYEWTSPQFETFVTTVPVLVLESLSLSDQGEWTLVINDGFCPSDPSAPSIVYVEPLPNISAASNSPVCDNEDLELTVNVIAGAIYSWTAPDGSTYDQPNPVVLPIPGTYTVSVTSALGCVNQDDTEVIVNQAPTITAISNNAVSCPSAPADILMFASVAPPGDITYSYAWTGGPNGGYFSNLPVAVIPNATSAANGAYTLVVTNGFGCMSEPVTTNVEMGEILPAPVNPLFVGDAPYCEGESAVVTTIDLYNGTDETYFWHTPTGIFETTSPSLPINSLGVINSGPYLVVVEVDGCVTDSSGVSNLVVNSIPQIAASSNSPVCEDDAIELFVNCFPGPDVSYIWSGPDGFNSSQCSPVIPDAETNGTGAYEVMVLVNGCPSAPATTNVIVNDRPDVPQIVPAGGVCLDDPEAALVLTVNPNTATTGASYSWFHTTLGQVGGPSPALTFVLTDFTNMSPGINSFFAVATLGDCESGPSLPVAIDFSQIPANQAEAGLDILGCENQPVNLQAVTPTVGAGLWTLIVGNPTGVVIANPDDPTTMVSGLIPGQTYSFQWALSNGACLDYSLDTVEVFVDIVDDAEAGVDIDTCSVNTVALNAQQPSVGAGFWTQPSAQAQLGIVITDPNDPNTTITGLVPGNQYLFTWNLPDIGCGLSTDVMFVRVIDAEANAGFDYDDCGPGCTVLSASAPDVGVGLWSSPDAGISFSDPADPDAEACNLQTGQNIFIWTLNNGLCGDAGSDTIVVNFKYEPVGVNDTIIVPYGTRVEFSVTDNDDKPADFFVEIIEGPDHGVLETLSAEGGFAFIPDIRYAGADGFTYNICSDGCDCSTGRVVFIIGENAPCQIPTIITPNNDGINDYFVIPCLSDPANYPENEVSIFNQWGDEVFRAKPYLNNWQGTYSGENLPDGTYFFIVRFAEGIPVENGFLIIHR